MIPCCCRVRMCGGAQRQRARPGGRCAGEPWFIRKLIDKHHKAAAAAGVRIVPTCGYDSIPSDLGAFFLARHAREKLGKCARHRLPPLLVAAIRCSAAAPPPPPPPPCCPPSKKRPCSTS